MRFKKLIVALGTIVIAAVFCSQAPEKPVELRSYRLDDLTGVIARSGIELDKEISADGNGSLRVTVAESTVVRLFEIGDIDIENAQLIYRAKLRTEDLVGQAYLEMWCGFEGKGEFFSRGLQSLLAGSNDWASTETQFFLKRGENPDNIRLSLVVNGSGTVWIDDIRLLKAPLR